MYQGANFFDSWNFFTDADPTHGLVNFQSQADAQTKNLVSFLDGKAVIAVDDYTVVPAGTNRNAVRITSKKTYNPGTLIIADFAAMPEGCGVWPAWWTVGPAWPAGGGPCGVNQYHLHTSDGCNLDPNQPMQGTVLTTTCASSAANNNGCGVQDKDPRSYGNGFNTAGGGVYAMYWGNDAIKMWHWARAEIPPDVASNKPNTAGWPTPAAAFTSGSSCDLSQHFNTHSLVIDTTICGDWAGASFQGAGCPGPARTTSRIQATSPWHINYIAVFN
ncbi:concanavalin A-like lectin/glucanase domain-containing protein [Mycena sp. CBHHK59/15]|nr:concanavalin A-like lectin/glucanase domain-containing protein [Mycena sp. CBHHK59/15]